MLVIFPGILMVLAIAKDSFQLLCILLLNWIKLEANVVF